MGPLSEEALREKIDELRALHDRATSAADQCLAFNRKLSELLDALETAGKDRLADKVMTLLLDCQPREGAQCEKSSMVAEKIKKL